jgi:hypothetical protein
MERFSEKDRHSDWFKDLDDLRRFESRKNWGEWFVIAGIVVEIFVGGWIAYNEEINFGQLKPREFNWSERQKAAAMLKQYAGTRVVIRWIEEDGETDSFANGVSNLLANVGCQVGMDNGWLVRGSGIDIFTRQKTDVAFSQALNDFLRYCNFTTQQRNDDWTNLPNAEVIVTIGFKGDNFSLSRSYKLEAIPLKK